VRKHIRGWIMKCLTFFFFFFIVRENSSFFFFCVDKYGKWNEFSSYNCSGQHSGFLLYSAEALVHES